MQLIDDERGATLASVSTKQLTPKELVEPKTTQAFRVGELIAQKAFEAGISQAVCDRRAYRYHGRVRALAEGARKAGLVL